MHRFLGQLPQNLELKRSEAKSDHRRISAATAEESKDNFEISLEEKQVANFYFSFFGARQIRTNEHSTLFRGASPERKRTIFVSKNIFW